jgi:hypothetical protein
MRRRDLLKSAAAATAASAAAQSDQPARTTAVRAAAAWKPKLFDAHQFETVARLVDLIIPPTDTPGAREARVHEYVDLILADGPAEPRTQFLQGLGWLDGYALRLHRLPFVRCPAAQQNAMLTAISRATPRTGQTLNRAGTPDRAAEPDRPVTPPARPGGPAEVDADLSPGAAFFSQIKMLTVDGYYTSPIGIKELNKSGAASAGFGCKHEEHSRG